MTVKLQATLIGIRSHDVFMREEAMQDKILLSIVLLVCCLSGNKVTAQAGSDIDRDGKPLAHGEWATVEPQAYADKEAAGKEWTQKVRDYFNAQRAREKAERDKINALAEADRRAADRKIEELKAEEEAKKKEIAPAFKLKVDLERDLQNVRTARSTVELDRRGQAQGATARQGPLMSPSPALEYLKAMKAGYDARGNPPEPEVRRGTPVPTSPNAAELNTQAQRNRRAEMQAWEGAGQPATGRRGFDPASAAPTPGACPYCGAPLGTRGEPGCPLNR